MDAVDWKTFSPNNGSVYAHHPNFQLLRNQHLLQSNRLTEKGEAVVRAYAELYENLERLIYQEMQKVVQVDQGFNYRFRRLRGDCVMLSHLTNLPERLY